MIAMFLDPDTRNSAIAVASMSRVLAVGVATNLVSAELEGRATSKIKVAEQCHRLYELTKLALERFDIDLAVAELPRDYGRNRNARPNDLIDLAAVTGAFLGPAMHKGVAVYPADYKGTVSKVIFQSRAFDYYKWKYTTTARGFAPDGIKRFKIPESVTLLTDIPSAAMADVADAVAGARWAVLHGKRRVGYREDDSRDDPRNDV